MMTTTMKTKKCFRSADFVSWYLSNDSFYSQKEKMPTQNLARCVIVPVSLCVFVCARQR